MWKNGIDCRYPTIYRWYRVFQELHDTSSCVQFSSTDITTSIGREAIVQTPSEITSTDRNMKNISSETSSPQISGKNAVFFSNDVFFSTKICAL